MAVPLKGSGGGVLILEHYDGKDYARAEEEEEEEEEEVRERDPLSTNRLQLQFRVILIENDAPRIELSRV